MPPQSPAERFEICVPTRGRLPNLMLLLQSLRTQTIQNWDITILDDNDPENILTNFYNFKVMLNLLHLEGHRWHVVRGFQTGFQSIHNILMTSSRHDLILRLDDDVLLENDYIEKLYRVMQDKSKQAAACGGVYPVPNQNQTDKYYMTEKDLKQAKQNKFESLKQRFLHREPKVEEVICLYSCWFYRRQAVINAGGFPTDISPLGEKEDTDTTFRLYCRGYKLFLHLGAVGWHFMTPSGGIRTEQEDEKRRQWFNHDVNKWKERLALLLDSKFDFQLEARRNLVQFEPFQEASAVEGNLILGYE